MSSRRQRSIPLGGRYRQVSLYTTGETFLCTVQWTLGSLEKDIYSCQTLFAADLNQPLIKDITSKLFIWIYRELSNHFHAAFFIGRHLCYCLSELAREIMFDYLKARKKPRMNSPNYYSPWKKLNMGVPHDSLLGSIFYNIFINDLCLFDDRCWSHNYADNNSINNLSPDLCSVFTNFQD